MYSTPHKDKSSVLGKKIVEFLEQSQTGAGEDLWSIACSDRAKKRRAWFCGMVNVFLTCYPSCKYHGEDSHCKECCALLLLNDFAPWSTPQEQGFLLCLLLSSLKLVQGTGFVHMAHIVWMVNMWGGATAGHWQPILLPQGWLSWLTELNWHGALEQPWHLMSQTATEGILMECDRNPPEISSHLRK